MPTAEIDAVRFQAASGATALEWSRIRGTKVLANLLVTGGPNAIDYHEGALDDVTDQKVRFTLSGETDARGVKRGKIFGLVYYHAARRTRRSAPTRSSMPPVRAGRRRP